MEAVWQWFAANPMVWPLVIWPALTGVLSLLQDQIKANAPGVWTFMQTSGLDLLGLLRMVAKQKKLPTPPESK